MAVEKRDFADRFAKNGRRTEWRGEEYALGWETVGIRPPTKEQFNFLFYRIDEKLAFLLDETGRIATSTQAGLVRRLDG